MTPSPAPLADLVNTVTALTTPENRADVVEAMKVVAQSGMPLDVVREAAERWSRHGALDPRISAALAGLACEHDFTPLRNWEYVYGRILDRSALLCRRCGHQVPMTQHEHEWIEHTTLDAAGLYFTCRWCPTTRREDSPTVEEA